VIDVSFHGSFTSLEKRVRERRGPNQEKKERSWVGKAAGQLMLPPRVALNAAKRRGKGEKKTAVTVNAVAPAEKESGVFDRAKGESLVRLSALSPKGGKREEKKGPASYIKGKWRGIFLVAMTGNGLYNLRPGGKGVQGLSTRLRIAFIQGPNLVVYLQREREKKKADTIAAHAKRLRVTATTLNALVIRPNFTVFSLGGRGKEEEFARSLAEDERENTNGMACRLLRQEEKGERKGTLSVPPCLSGGLEDGEEPPPPLPCHAT